MYADAVVGIKTVTKYNCRGNCQLGATGLSGHNTRIIA